MKTLDEVIIGIREQMGFGDPILVDALHYLKEYREKKDDLERTKKMCFEFVGTKMIEAENQGRTLICPNCGDEFIILPESNNALTWEELQQMEGKPVWVEQHHGDTKGWLLILRKYDDVVTCTTKYGNSFYLYKANYGEKWQAYRKERKNETD